MLRTARAAAIKAVNGVSVLENRSGKIEVSAGVITCGGLLLVNAATGLNTAVRDLVVPIVTSGRAG